MSDQAFINTYVRILNDTLTEAFNKNIVLQAQLEVATANANKAAELENKLREMGNVVAENDALRSKILELNELIELTTKKYNSLEIFKRELIDARALIKAQGIELHRLKYPNESEVDSVVVNQVDATIEVDSKKKKKNKKETEENTPNNISVDETF